MTDAGRFWLFDWLDEYEVRTDADIARLLERENIREDLRRRAAEALPSVLSADLPGSGPSIVAGAGIDLSAWFNESWEHIRDQVDGLFTHTWHYFDRIVVVGPSTGEIAHHQHPNDPEAEDRIFRRLQPHLRLLLHLREIGAENLLVFRDKATACVDHLEAHCAEAGLTEAYLARDELIHALVAKAEVDLEKRRTAIVVVPDRVAQIRSELLAFRFDHPELDAPFKSYVHPYEIASLSDRERSVYFARRVVDFHLAHLAADVQTARIVGSPLGTVDRIHRRLLRFISTAKDDSEIAFNLTLPWVQGISARDLLKLRAEEQETFDRFRTALRAAIRERAKTSKDVEREILDDLLLPALKDIDYRLRLARRTLIKKSLPSLVIGGVATVIGVFTTSPSLIAAGTGVSGTAIPAFQKFVDDDRDVKLSGLYFAWKSERAFKSKRRS